MLHKEQLSPIKLPSFTKKLHFMKLYETDVLHFQKLPLYIYIWE